MCFLFPGGKFILDCIGVSRFQIQPLLMKPVLEPVLSLVLFWPFLFLFFRSREGYLFLFSVSTWGVHTPIRLVIIFEEHH